MVEEARGNGQSDMPPAMPDGPQQLIVNAQYIKDLSFENPRAPQSLIQQTTQPSVDINVDVKAQNLGPEVFEVVLTINATARIEEDRFVLDAGRRIDRQDDFEILRSKILRFDIDVDVDRGLCRLLN